MEKIIWNNELYECLKTEVENILEILKETEFPEEHNETLSGISEALFQTAKESILKQEIRKVHKDIIDQRLEENLFGNIKDWYIIGKLEKVTDADFTKFRFTQGYLIDANKLINNAYKVYVDFCKSIYLSLLVAQMKVIRQSIDKFKGDKE